MIGETVDKIASELPVPSPPGRGAGVAKHPPNGHRRTAFPGRPFYTTRKRSTQRREVSRQPFSRGSRLPVKSPPDHAGLFLGDTAPSRLCVEIQLPWPFLLGF